MPQVKQKTAAKPKKLSAVFKASMKAKASLKDKPAPEAEEFEKASATKCYIWSKVPCHILLSFVDASESSG